MINYCHMHTVIIAQNLPQAIFIKKGLYYENLSCDVMPFNNGYIPKNDILVVDGVFLLMDDPVDIESVSDICRKIKQDIPIIVLMAQYEVQMERLINEGKVNFIFTRPFSFRQMSAEMRFTIFHQKEKIETGNYVLRDLELDLLSHQVRYKNRHVYLRNKEFSLLHFLMANKGKLLTRTEILENVWDRNANIMTNTVDVHISQLRRKFDLMESDKYIHTIPCTGYIFE